MSQSKQEAIDFLWSSYQHLPPPDKTIMRLKALIGTCTTKTLFLSTLGDTKTVGFDGNPWSHKNLNPALDNLIHHGLLQMDYSCTGLMLHPIAADAGESQEAPLLAKAICMNFPANNRTRSNQYSYILQTDWDAMRRLRLAIYINDTTTYLQLIEEYNQHYNPNRGPYILLSLFLDIHVDLDWLANRHPSFQINIFFIKLKYFLETGFPGSDLAALLIHYQKKQEEPEFVIIQTGLLEYDILAGNLTRAETKISKSQDPLGYHLMTIKGSLAFLKGDNALALENFDGSLKLYKKESGKRKIFMNGSNGLFALMAYFQANDPSLYPVMQTHLDAVVYEGNLFGKGFIALQALLCLMQGQEAKAKTTLTQLRMAMPKEPLSAACIILVERLVDPDAAQKNLKNTATRFEQLKDCLPMVARIHAEVLTQLTPKGSPVHDTFLQESNPNEKIITFTNIIQISEPWERALENLGHFLYSGSQKPVTSTPQKTKRLVWFLDVNNFNIETLEQSPKGRDGWTPGRAVALKRLYEQDPRLDYLSPQDRQALRTIRKDVYGWYNKEEYSFSTYKTLIALIGHPLLFNAQQREQQLELVPYPVELIVKEQGSGYKITLSHLSAQPTVFLEAETKTRYRVIEVSSEIIAVGNLLGTKGQLTVPRHAKKQVVSLVQASHPLLPIRAEIAAIDLPAIEGETLPSLQLQPYEEGLKVNLVVRPFGVEGPCYLVGQGGHSILALLKGQQQRVNRNLAKERQAATQFVASCPTLLRLGASDQEWLITELESCLEFLLEIQASPHPHRVEWPEGERLKVSKPVSTKNLSLKLNQARDWFQISGTIQVDEALILDMRDLLNRMEGAKGRFVLLADGSFLALTRQFQKQLERLRQVTEEDSKGRRLSLPGSLAIQDMVEEAGVVKADRQWQEFAERLKASGEHQPTLPSTLQAELRDYQVEGFVWLSRLAYWGTGACLADDMGLGKTVQAIAIMLDQTSKGPILVISPTSVCHNWEAELDRFAPTLKVHRLSDTKDRAELIESIGAMDVLVISYGLLNQEIDQLAARRWQMVIFDEAQAVKNAATQRSKASQRLQAAFRLALTGTPIENYLEELWSLFAIITPGLLGSKESFQRRFATPIERNRQDGALQALRTLIRPFILRRTKSAVLAELPPRTEVTLEITLPDDERAFYEALRRKAMESLAQMDTGEAGQRRIHILAEITRLRRCCCNPGLIDPATDIAGAKLETFLELVNELIRNHHKALVFSQFVGQLERVRSVLDAKGIRYQYLDGSTPAKDREKRVTAFQGGEGDLFLISLKAGGTGLNLTAADYVIHLDPWWNPAVEDQASDRAHRIGQLRPVTVYRLIVQESIEEKILQLHRHKRDLATDLLEGAEISGRLSEEDLLDLIRL